MTSTLGQRLRTEREFAGLTQQELASKAGVCTKTVSSIERDRIDPRASTVAKIEQAIEKAARTK